MADKLTEKAVQCYLSWRNELKSTVKYYYAPIRMTMKEFYEFFKEDNTLFKLFLITDIEGILKIQFIRTYLS